MKISVIIPAYEAKGRAIELLTELFDSLEVQTYKNFEVVVSDHSKNNDIENFCKTRNLDVIHFYNDRGRGNSSINMNEGIKRATGDVIKVVHMDDVVFNPETFRLITELLEKNPDKKWGAVGFNHNYEDADDGEEKIRRIIIPSIDTVIGCPSVSFFRVNNDDPDFFDENLIIINDHDMHQRLFKKYGEPVVVSEICITIRMHQEQVSSWIGSKKEKEEWKYFKLKMNE